MAEVRHFDIGWFDVTTDHASVSAFARAVDLAGSTETEAVPFTYPICWLADPAVREIIRTEAEPAGGVLIHESQTIVCHIPLVRDRTYRVKAEGRVSSARRDRLTITAIVEDDAGRRAAELECVLLAVPRPGHAETSDE